MTMPHLMNCGHSDDGHCLDCVKAAGEERESLRAQLATAQAELARVTKKVEDAEKIRDFAVDLVNRAKAALEREGWEGGESLEEWRIAARVLLEKFDPKMLASGLCSFEQHLERHRETVRRVTAERDGARAMMFRYAMSLSGRFWRCLKCKHITHSHTCVHPCKCGNRPSAGYFTSATFDEWNGQNPGRQDEWIALAHQAASLEDPTPEGKP